MKITACLIFTISIFIAINAYERAEGADWKLYAETPNYNFYYNADSMAPRFLKDIHLLEDMQRMLNFVMKNTVKVWTKRSIKNDMGRTLQLQEHKRLGLSVKGYENYQHTLSLKELNCRDKTVRLLLEADYTEDGNILGKEETPYAALKPVAPESNDDLLHKTLCSISLWENKQTGTK